MTYAVIRLGGRQFKVSEGDIIELERQSSGKNDVLLFSDGKKVEIGEPMLDKFEVVLKKLEDKRAEKIRVARFKSKSRYRRVKGHKQPVSVFSVEKVGAKSKKTKKAKTTKKSTKSSSKKKNGTRKKKE